MSVIAKEVFDEFAASELSAVVRDGFHLPRKNETYITGGRLDTSNRPPQRDPIRYMRIRDMSEKIASETVADNEERFLTVRQEWTRLPELDDRFEDEDGRFWTVTEIRSDAADETITIDVRS